MSGWAAVATVVVFVLAAIGAAYWAMATRAAATDVVIVYGRPYRVVRVDDQGEPTLVRIGP